MSEQGCGELPITAQLPFFFVNEQRHIEFRMGLERRQQFHAQPGHGAGAHRHVVHHEQHLEQRVHALVSRYARGFDNLVERQVLMLQGAEQVVLGLPQEARERGRSVEARTQGQYVDEETDQPLQLRLFTTCHVGPDHQVLRAAEPMQQHLEGRQQRAVQRDTGLAG